MVVRNMRNRDFAETRTPLGVIGGFIGLVAASAAAATLVVVGVTPAIATVGIAASGTIGMFENLPGYLEIGELSEKSNIYATRSDGVGRAARLVLRPEPGRGRLGRDQPVREGRRHRRRGPAVLRSRRHRHPGHRARGGHDRHRPRDAGRLLHRPAVREERARAGVRADGRRHRARGPHRGGAGGAHRRRAPCAHRGGAARLLRHGHRDHDRPQAQGDAPRDRRREALHEERDPARLPEHRRIRRHGVRHRGGRQLLLQHLGREPLARAGGIADGDRQQPREVPARQARQRDERRRQRLRGEHRSAQLHPHEHARAAEDHPGRVRHGRSRRPCNPRSPSRAPGARRPAAARTSATT